MTNDIILLDLVVLSKGIKMDGEKKKKIRDGKKICWKNSAKYQK